MSRFQPFAPRRSSTRPLIASAIGPVILLGLGLGLGSGGCGTKNYYETEYIFPSQGQAGSSTGPVEDAGVPSETATPDAGDAADAGPEPPDGLPPVTTEPGALAVDVLGAVGNRYYFVVSEEQLGRMNERYLGGGFPGAVYGDIYTPGGGGGDATFVDRLLVSTPGEAPQTADYGKVQVKLVGESTGRPWTTTSLPNFKLDTDEFIEKNRIGGVKHFRLNNAIVGSIFREKLTLDLYAKLGYPAPRASYAWVQSSVWGPDIEVPYIVVESYKPAFCTQRESALNGGCVNMWEFAGDLGYGQLGLAESCQFSECDATRAVEFEELAVDTPPGDGFKAALADWLDWDAFHRFQCLSWILATGDDVLHNSNNFVMMERSDGKFQHLPYSIDISLGQEWYPEVTLAGGSLLARGCQSDPQCWDDMILVCDDLVAAFIAANPIAMLDENYALLSQQGMLRDGDEERYRTLSSYLARRIEELPEELDENRAGPPIDIFCDYPFVQCGDVCLLPEECFVCEPEPEPGSPPADAGPLDREAADIAIPLPDPGGPIIDPPPQECVPFVEEYEIPGR
jgi:hypothetical protein